jgi:hypothetical protein
VDVSGDARLMFGCGAVWIALSLAVAGCVSPQRPDCKRGEQAAIQDSLYFGTGTPHGAVTPEEWAEFLEHTVTPRFPQGLTVLQASGQWRASGGPIVRESTHVLLLVHPDDAQSETSIAAIVAAYRTTFQQNSVLRVTANACVSF